MKVSPSPTSPSSVWTCTHSTLGNSPSRMVSTAVTFMRNASWRLILQQAQDEDSFVGATNLMLSLSKHEPGNGSYSGGMRSSVGSAQSRFGTSEYQPGRPGSRS